MYSLCECRGPDAAAGPTAGPACAPRHPPRLGNDFQRRADFALDTLDNYVPPAKTGVLCDPRHRRQPPNHSRLGSALAVDSAVESERQETQEKPNLVEIPAPVPAQPLPAEPLTGETVDGRYLIGRRLGAGGMGAVFCAEDLRLGRSVALKFLLEGFTRNPPALKRFRSEARILSALNHPNICAIYDIVETDGRVFIAMEYIAGQRLEELIQSHSLRQADILKYAVQIAGALAKAHAAGIVHRDLKPGNIMVDAEGQVKLLDFGVAKLTGLATTQTAGATAATLTEIGSIVGTAAYMSPEQAEARIVDGRADVFAFGAVLYEMLTGRRAFEGQSRIATLAAVLRAEPEPLSRIAPAVPPELGRIVSRCLRKARSAGFKMWPI